MINEKNTSHSFANQAISAIKFLWINILHIGLRLGEVVRLQINDIDGKRMLIKVRQGKGRKDRYTLLSKVALEQLRKYYKIYRPEKW